MKVTIDPAGRLVIPKRFREALGVSGGGAVEVDLVDGSVVVSAPTVAKQLIERDGRAVVVAGEALPPLTDAVVDAVIAAVRR